MMYIPPAYITNYIGYQLQDKDISNIFLHKCNKADVGVCMYIQYKYSSSAPDVEQPELQLIHTGNTCNVYYMHVSGGILRRMSHEAVP